MCSLGELIKPGNVKCVLNEGMPLHRRPYEKGRLIINFTVSAILSFLPSEKGHLLLLLGLIYR